MSDLASRNGLPSKYASSGSSNLLESSRPLRKCFLRDASRQGCPRRAERTSIGQRELITSRRWGRVGGDMHRGASRYRMRHRPRRAIEITRSLRGVNARRAAAAAVLLGQLEFLLMPQRAKPRRGTETVISGNGRRRIAVTGRRRIRRDATRRGATPLPSLDSPWRFLARDAAFGEAPRDSRLTNYAPIKSSL